MADDSTRRAEPLAGIYPEGATAYRSDGTEIKVGDLVHVGEELELRIDGEAFAVTACALKVEFL